MRLPYLIALLISPCIQTNANASMHNPLGFGPLMIENTLSTDNSSSIADIRDAKNELITLNTFTSSQIKPDDLWSQKDFSQTQIEGTSTELVYQNFQVPHREVIVAVIDGGVDIHHEDLQGKIWTNSTELGNDEDHDGYVGDVHGWNFIGSLNETTLEVTRELNRMASKAKLAPLNDDEQKYVATLTSKYQSLYNKTNVSILKLQPIANAFLLLRQNHISLEHLSVSDSDAFPIQNAKSLAISEMKNGATESNINERLSAQLALMNYGLNGRAAAPEIFGNSDVIGPNPLHGTHVAGIIAATRSNQIGIDGQASAVKIMPLRVVPNGDERDEDVANAIHYAVDHHARIINMSFGKPFSPKKSLVDEAVHYAEAHDVLLVHAAGNDGASNETYDQNFPNAKNTSDGHFASNWVEVGASGPSDLIDNEGQHSLAASFSNFGQHSVDLFAPGVSIISTINGNQYADLNGTSMAAPEVSGIAALLLQFNPSLTAVELKQILMASVNKRSDVEVVRPGSWKRARTVDGKIIFDGTHVSFGELSASGGIVNAYNAVMLLKSFHP